MATSTFSQPIMVPRYGMVERWPGRLCRQRQRLGQSQAQAVALGDLDGDGDLDAYVADSLVDSVWLNDDRGQFVASGQLLPDSYSRDIALVT